ncbi:MAG: pyridoxamine 5'-phosphate oxidase family protein [Chloroflexota bacterium]|nr:pyridoxamine 5'-phosphate oxidase family protein [Chloroflexota bacterium]
MKLLSLATVNRHGEPRVGPVDGLFYRGRFWFGSSPKAARFRHIRARPAVSVTISTVSASPSPCTGKRCRSMPPQKPWRGSVTSSSSLRRAMVARHWRASTICLHRTNPDVHLLHRQPGFGLTSAATTSSPARQVALVTSGPMPGRAVHRSGATQVLRKFRSRSC